MPNNDILETYIGTCDVSELPKYVGRVIDDWSNYMVETGRIKRIRNNYSAYYALSANESFWDNYGSRQENGNYIKLVVNQYKNLIKNAIATTLPQMPVFQAGSCNNSAKLDDQIEVYNSQLLYDARHGYMDSVIKSSMTSSFIMSTAFVIMEWAEDAGEQIELFDGTVATTGDITTDCLTILDVFFDVTKKRFQDLDWIIVRQKVNKYKLAKLFPEYEHDILSKNDISDSFFPENSTIGYFNASNRSYNDDVYIYKYIHKDDKVICPGGRYSIILDNNTCIYDAPNKYGQIPVFKLSPSERIYGVYGDTDADDMYMIQKLNDAITSCLMTKVGVFGLDKIFVDSNSLMSSEALSGGLKIFKLAPQSRDPRVVSLMGNISELANLAPMVQGWMESVSNIYAANRGAPDPSTKVATTLSMMQQMGQRFYDDFKRNVFRFASELANFALKLRKRNMGLEQTIKIVGEDSKFKAIRISKSSISDLDYINIQDFDPVSTSIGGRVMMAEKISQMTGNVTYYLDSLKTGNVQKAIDEFTLDDNTAELENCLILKGECPSVVDEDNHSRHAIIHRKTILDPDSRKDPNIMRAYTEHMKLHDIGMINSAKKSAYLQEAIRQSQIEAAPQQNNGEQIAQEPNVSQNATNMPAMQHMPAITKG